MTAVSDVGFSTKSKTFIVDDEARITVDGESAALADLQPGMRVLVTSKLVEKGASREDSLFSASRITARSASGNGPQGNGKIGNDSQDEESYDTGALLAECQKWTNGQGQEINAAIRSASQGKVVFVMADGKEVPYPMRKLSLESQQKILEITGS